MLEAGTKAPEFTRQACAFAGAYAGLWKKGTLCKMARGEMVRRMAERGVTSPEKLKTLQLSNYIFDEIQSDDGTYVYLRKHSNTDCQ